MFATRRFSAHAQWSSVTVKRSPWGAVFILLGSTLLSLVTLAAPLRGLEVPEENQDKPLELEPVIQAIDALGGAETGMVRARATRALLEFGPKALEIVRKAVAEESDPEKQRRLEQIAVQLLAEKLSKVIEKRREAQLIYDGLYDDLKQEGDMAASALFYLLDDEATPAGIRLGAIDALADVADDTLLSKLRDLESDPLLLPGLRRELGTLLAILGDTRKIDHRIRELEKLAASEDPNDTYFANGELSNLYYKVRLYSKATECYENILKIFKLVRERFPPGSDLRETVFSDQSMALQHYNAACSYSLDKRIDKAREHLRQAVELDPIHYNNLEVDGDLKNVREAEGHDAFKKELARKLQERSI